jgi:hypothetical protein
MKILYKLLEKGFIEWIINKQKIKFDTNSLKLEFTDLQGKQYYSFTKEVMLPISRLAKLQEYVMWLQKGVDSNEYDALLDLADEALTSGLTNKKGGSKVGFVLAELKDRKNMVVHEELFYNFIAVQLVRSDESTTDFNNEIQMQKVAAIRELNKSDEGFFLTIQKFLVALNLSNITKEELAALLEESITRTEATRKLLQSLSGRV